MCGDWERAAIFAAWPEAIAFELASFVWPITELPELLRLLQGLAARHASLSLRRRVQCYVSS